MSRRTRRFSGAAFFVALALGVALYEPAAEGDADERVVFAMSVQGSDGRVLASPVVVGEAGQKLEVRLMCELDPRLERMSLVLEPVSESDGLVRYAYELSVAGHFRSERGTVELSPGRERRISVRPDDPRGVTLALYASPIRRAGLEKYLKERRLRLARTAS